MFLQGFYRDKQTFKKKNLEKGENSMLRNISVTKYIELLKNKFTKEILIPDQLSDSVQNDSVARRLHSSNNLIIFVCSYVHANDSFRTAEPSARANQNRQH